MAGKQASTAAGGEDVREIAFRGHALLEKPLFNQGTAFTAEERDALGLRGLLPPHVETLEEQVARAYDAFRSKATDLGRHIYMRGLQDTNETLFYALMLAYITEMMPILYTPVVGEACQKFSEIYRRARGLFIGFEDRHRIDAILDNTDLPETKVIVVTDGGRILGLGDQGVGGLGIPIGKLSLYTACGGIDPASTLPIVLDVGTDNKTLLEDPLYLGWRHPRIPGPEYDTFIDHFVCAIERKFPNVLLQWEDFPQNHAYVLLGRYRDQLCTFNDDIQGTAAVACGTLLAAVRAADSRIGDQRIAIVGAGSAGCGIASQIKSAMIAAGLGEEEAAARFYMVDRVGLLHDGLDGILDFQASLVQKRVALDGWTGGDGTSYDLADVVRNAHPTVLIGVSGQPGLFTEEIVREMARWTERPIVFPLSNPTSRSEACPADVIDWTDGHAIVATGSPFAPVEHGDRTHVISQNNNAYIFPGIGLGVLGAGARRVTDNMMMAAGLALSGIAPAAREVGMPILPPLSEIRAVSRAIALAVGKAAIEDGVAEPMADAALEQAIDATMWTPRYRPIKCV
jgi:malate dehydrogenase (oxaloacetate-decarboxylating)